MINRKEGSTPKQAVPQKPWRSPAQAATLIGVGVIIAIVIGALYLAQATMTATTGSELLQLQRTREYLQRANSDTQAQIAQKRNISTLKGRAQELGFQPAGPDDLKYIVVEGYSPIRATPTPTPVAESPLVYDETFTGWFQHQWDALVKQFEQWMGRGQSTPVP